MNLSSRLICFRISTRFSKKSSIFVYSGLLVHEFLIKYQSDCIFCFYSGLQCKYNLGNFSQRSSNFLFINSLKILGCATKGQIISKCLFGVLNFFQKMNENTSHCSKNELIRSFFGSTHGMTICFRN